MYDSRLLVESAALPMTTRVTSDYMYMYMYMYLGDSATPERRMGERKMHALSRAATQPAP